MNQYKAEFVDFFRQKFTSIKSKYPAAKIVNKLFYYRPNESDFGLNFAVEGIEYKHSPITRSLIDLGREKESKMGQFSMESICEFELEMNKELNRVQEEVYA